MSSSEVESLVRDLEGGNLLHEAADIVEPGWEDDYVSAWRKKRADYSINDYAKDVLREELTMGDRHWEEVKNLLE